MTRFKEWLFESEKHDFSCVMHVIREPKLEQKILNWTKDNVPSSSLTAKGHETEPHVTILFGLHTHDPADVESIIKSFEPFDIKFGAITKFSNEEFDVLKIAVHGQGLEKMNRALSKLPNSNRHPTYQAHCTLAYVQKDSCNELLKDKTFQGATVTVKDVVFSPPSGKKVTISL